MKTRNAFTENCISPTMSLKQYKKHTNETDFHRIAEKITNYFLLVIMKKLLHEMKLPEDRDILFHSNVMLKLRKNCNKIKVLEWRKFGRYSPFLTLRALLYALSSQCLTATYSSYSVLITCPTVACTYSTRSN